MIAFPHQIGDNWDNAYGYTLAANGTASVIYFLFVVFFGSFFLQKLIIAVIAESYGHEIDIIEAKNREHREKRLLRKQAKINKKLARKRNKSKLVSDKGRMQLSLSPETSASVMIPVDVPNAWVCSHHSMLG